MGKRLSCLLTIAAAVAMAATADKGRILVVTDSSVAAYQEAVEGLREGLGPSAAAVVETAPSGVAKALSSASVTVAVAVGLEAREALLRANAQVPVISTMLLLSDAAEESGALARPAGSVYLDLSLPRIAAEIGKLFPGKTRLGIITDAGRRGAPNQKTVKQLAQSGYSVELAQCANSAEIARVIGALKGKADLVLALAETDLFNSRTIGPLLRASLEQELPVIGFSPAFLNAGAIAAVHPDFRDVGRQTAELVERSLAGKTDGGEETARKVVSAANPRIKRLLGWK